MATCTEFFLAPAAEAERLRQLRGKAGSFPSIELRGIGLVDMLYLGTLLTKTTCLPDTVLEPTEKTPFSVTKVCRDLLEALPGLATSSHRTTVVAAWKKGTPHFGAVPLEVLDEVLQELAALSSKALSEGKELLELHNTSSP